jgi:hypothetical protein
MSKSFKLFWDKKDYKKREIRRKNLLILLILLEMMAFCGFEIFTQVSNLDPHTPPVFFTIFVVQLYFILLFAFVRLKNKLQELHGYEFDLHRPHLNKFMLCLTVTFMIILGQNILPLFDKNVAVDISDLSSYEQQCGQSFFIVEALSSVIVNDTGLI